MFPQSKLSKYHRFTVACYQTNTMFGTEFSIQTCEASVGHSGDIFGPQKTVKPDCSSLPSGGYCMEWH